MMMTGRRAGRPRAPSGARPPGGTGSEPRSVGTSPEPVTNVRCVRKAFVLGVDRRSRQTDTGGLDETNRPRMEPDFFGRDGPRALDALDRQPILRSVVVSPQGLDLADCGSRPPSDGG